MRIKDEIFCFAHLRWCHNGWASNILIVVDTGYAGIHHSKYWMPIHMTPSKMGKTKNLIFYSLITQQGEIDINNLKQGKSNHTPLFIDVHRVGPSGVQPMIALALLDACVVSTVYHTPVFSGVHWVLPSAPQDDYISAKSDVSVLSTVNDTTLFSVTYIGIGLAHRRMVTEVLKAMSVCWVQSMIRHFLAWRTLGLV